MGFTGPHHLLRLVPLIDIERDDDPISHCNIF
jgi:hypothetical protein